MKPARKPAEDTVIITARCRSCRYSETGTFHELQNYGWVFQDVESGEEMGMCLDCRLTDAGD